MENLSRYLLKSFILLVITAMFIRKYGKIFFKYHNKLNGLGPIYSVNLAQNVQHTCTKVITQNWYPQSMETLLKLSIQKTKILHFWDSEKYEYLGLRKIYVLIYK